MPPVAAALNNLLAQRAADGGQTRSISEVMPEPVHRFCSAPPALNPWLIAQGLKGASVRWPFSPWPHLRRRLWDGQLWNPSYALGPARPVSEETIKSAPSSSQRRMPMLTIQAQIHASFWERSRLAKGRARKSRLFWPPVPARLSISEGWNSCR